MAQKSSEIPTESGSRPLGESDPFRRGSSSNGNGGSQTGQGANVQGANVGSRQESERRGASESRGQQGRYYQSALDRLNQRSRSFSGMQGQGRSAEEGSWNDRNRWSEQGSFGEQSRGTEQGRPSEQGSWTDRSRWNEQGRGEPERWNQKGRSDDQDRSYQGDPDRWNQPGRLGDQARWNEQSRLGEQDRWNRQGRFNEQGRWNEQDRWRERGQGRGFGEGPSFRPGRQESSEQRGRFGAGESGIRPGLWQREALTTRDIMTRNIKAVSPESTLKEAAQIMRDENVGIVPVVDQNRRLLGVLTDRDIVVRVVAEDRMPSQVRVQEVMTESVEVVTENEEVRDVIELMGKKQIRRVPVVDENDRLVGIVSLGDIANRADYDEELQEALQKISSKRSFWNRLFG